MNAPDEKETLHLYLKRGREALLWKLDGLDDYDVRRPMTATGTNLLGLVKHLASVGVGYLGDVFDRPSGIELPWFADDAEPNADLWVPAQESREQIIDLHHRAWAHADATVEALDLDAEGTVPWWGERGQVTLHQILVHITTEAHRHAGHADIIRELIDGAVGVREGMDNMWAGDADDYWPQHCRRIEEAARAAAGHTRSD